MVTTIFKIAQSDTQLDKLLAEAKDFAQVYVFARKRQKGCDGMGELAVLKEEFRDIADKVLLYCKEKKYIPDDISYDIDSVADEIVKQERPL